MPEEEKVKEKDEDKSEKPQKKTKTFLNKVVIRKLPPNLNSESFLEIVSPLPDYCEFYFVTADFTLGAEATSRAYIEFRNEEDIFIFKDKFDGYVFVDSVRGSEYPAIVEYAAFQGLPKSRARKKDKNVGTIESEQHFLNFLEQLSLEEADNQKNEPKLEFSYQIKDDKKITSTPLIEFLAAKNQEKRDAKKKKIEEKKKQRDDEKQKKKIQVAKNVPEPIKEAKEDLVYEDGIMVRTVPSRLGRNERKKESKADAKPDKDSSEKEQDRREKREKEKNDRESRRKQQKEKDEKRKANQDQQKTRGQKKAPADVEKPAPAPPKETAKDTYKEAPAKNETKRYSALRKARQEKTSEVKDTVEAEQKPDELAARDDTENATNIEEAAPSKADEEKAKRDEARKEARMRKMEEIKARRAREADERAQRHIKNKDRPSLQIYQPKRRPEGDRPDNLKSSDENSETSRKRSDNDRRSDKRERRTEKKPSRKNSREEAGRRKKTSRKNSDEGAGEKFDPVDNTVDETITEKLEKLVLKPSHETPETPKSETVCETPVTKSGESEE